MSFVSFIALAAALICAVACVHADPASMELEPTYVTVPAAKSDTSTALAIPQRLEPPVTILSEITKQDENSIAMLSLPDGGRMSRCRSSGSVYLHLPNSGQRMNVVAQSPPYNITRPEDLTIKFAGHNALASVFPTTAILFTNESCTRNETNFRLFTLTMLDLVTEPEDEHLIYKVEIRNATRTLNLETEQVAVDELFYTRGADDVMSQSAVSFPTGTMMMDLIDIHDGSIDEERKQYTLAHMADTGELTYNADRFARSVADGGDYVTAQGVLTLWLLGPFSIPLYPAFIVCCAFSLLIWYTIQPFLFCCII